MKQSKKTWLGAASIALTLSLAITGCGNGGGNDTSAQEPASTTTDTQTQKEAPIEITWANNFNAPEADNNYVQKQLEEKFNVKITNIKLERSTWKDKFSVLLASGQIPDIFPIDANETDMAQWADQGIIANISPDEIKTMMPNYMAALDAVDAGAWDVGDYKGKSWGIPKVWPGGLDAFMPGYNEAWLKKIGYNEPPKTLEELEDVLTKFVNNDPDGDGKKDTYGMSGRGKLPEQAFTSVFSAYGISPYEFKLGADGKVVWGGITEETRSSLKLLSKWYKGGLIDPEFITTDNNQLNEKFANQKIGMVDNMKWGNFYKESGFITKPGLDKGQTIIAGKPIVGPAGEPYGFAYGARQAPVILGVQLEKDEKKRAKIMQILDYVATNPEGWLLTVYGQKGVNYDMNGDFVTPKVEPEAAATKAGAGSFYNPLNAVDAAMSKYNTSQELLDLKAKLSPNVKPLLDVVGPAVLSTKTQYWGNLKTLEDTYIIKAVTGEADTDKAFDEFKAQWLQSGGQAVTDEVNQVYAERSKK